MSQDNQDAIERLTRIERKLDEHREEEKNNGKRIDGLTSEVSGLKAEVSGLSANVGKMDETLRGFGQKISELVRR